MNHTKIATFGLILCILVIVVLLIFSISVYSKNVYKGKDNWCKGNGYECYNTYTDKCGYEVNYHEPWKESYCSEYE